MVASSATKEPLGDTDVFLRLWARHKLTPTLARHLLRVEFGAEDQERIFDLSERNQAGRLTAAEAAELDSYVRVGMWLSVMQSRARKLLKKTSRPANGRG